MRLTFLALSCSTAIGCGSGNTDWARKQIGLPSEAEAKAEEARKAAESDLLVDKWAEKLAGQDRYEGVTEADSWGNLLKVEYKQDWTDEIMTVRSAGPDGAFHSGDDLVRTRTRAKPQAVLSGLPGWAYVAGLWLMCGLLALVVAGGLNSRRRRVRNRKTRREHPLPFTLCVMVLAPLALLFYTITFIGSIVGGAFGDDDFLLDFDFDLG